MVPRGSIGAVGICSRNDPFRIRYKMPIFQVKVKEVHTQIITVEADDAVSARTVAETVVESGIQQDGSNLPDETSYAFTLEKDEWDVWEA